MKTINWNLSLFSTIVLLLMGCSDNNNKPSPNPDSEEPFYVISNTLSTTDNVTTYLTTVSSLEDPSINVELGDHLEFSGRGKVYGLTGELTVYLSSLDEPTFTEVKFDENGSPTIGRKISFANLGVAQTFSGLNVFFSPTKAYHVNSESLEIIVWNPQEMIIEKTFPSGLSSEAGFSLVLLNKPIVVNNKLILVANKFNEDLLAVNGSILTVINMGDDSVLSSEEDSRGAALLIATEDGTGDIYFSSNWLAAASHFLYGELAAAPVMLRIKVGETRFDPDWSRTLTEDLGTTIWMGAIPAPDGGMFFQSIEEDNSEVLTAKDDDNVWAVRNSRPWKWHVATSGEGDTEPITNDDLDFPVSLAPINVDGKDYFLQYDGKISILTTLSTSNQLINGTEIPGLASNILKIR